MSTDRSSAQEDREAVEAYRRRYGPGPFLTADAVVQAADGLVLLVRRSKPPGRGLLAFPGGFVNADETCLDAARRELAEETGLDKALPQGTSGLKPSAEALFDAPDRDARARIVSLAYLFRLERDSGSLPLAAGDDAADARWFDVNSLAPQDFYADHYLILRHFGLNQS